MIKRKRLARIFVLPVIPLAMVAGLVATTQPASAATSWKDIASHSAKESFEPYTFAKATTFTRIQEKGKYRRAAIQIRSYSRSDRDKPFKPFKGSKVSGKLTFTCNWKPSLGEPPTTFASKKVTNASSGKDHILNLSTKQINKSRLKGCASVYAHFTGTVLINGGLVHVDADSRR